LSQTECGEGFLSAEALVKASALLAREFLHAGREASHGVALNSRDRRQL
jgi:hypothetical protein